MAIAVTQTGIRRKALITITAGTPIPLAVGPEPVKAHRVQIQMRAAAGGGQGLVYDDVIPNMDPATIAALCGPPTQLAAATDADTPGGEYNDVAEANGFIDLRTIAVDGAVTGNEVMANAPLKI